MIHLISWFCFWTSPRREKKSNNNGVRDDQRARSSRESSQQTRIVLQKAILSRVFAVAHIFFSLISCGALNDPAGLSTTIPFWTTRTVICFVELAKMSRASLTSRGHSTPRRLNTRRILVETVLVGIKYKC